MNISSPVATGNGAYIVHKTLAENIQNYQVNGYNPYWTLFPPALSLLNTRKQLPDLIHTTPDYAYFFRKKNIPMIITFHGYMLDYITQKYSTTIQKIHSQTDLKFFTKLAIKSTNKVTAVSHFTANLIKNDLKYDKDIEVIYNGIDTKKFYPLIKKTRNTIKVLFSGNLTKRKGADLLPKIVAKLDKNIQIIFTSGLRTRHHHLPDSPQLKNIGSIPYSEMAKVYQEVDILLFPTVREGFGLAAVEAMACGIPVIATNCSSLPELVVHGKGGYLCSIRNIDEFATRINELANSPTLRKEMGEFNRARVEKNFTLEKMIYAYQILFEQVADNK